MKILSHNLDGIKVVQNRFHFLFRDFLQTGDVGGSLHTTLPPLVINDTQGRVGWLGLGEEQQDYRSPWNAGYSIYNSMNIYKWDALYHISVF